MGLFRHPHLVRGIVHTSQGSFAISRGLVSAPDEVGESHGWARQESEDQRDRPPSNAGGPVRGDAMPLEL
jgi:hypothetical protein